MSLWNQDTIRDVSESVGISNISDEVANNLAMDVEYRIHQVLQEATKYMRHAKRFILTTSDVLHALRVLNVEPLYGYDCPRPLRYGEASIGPAQPVFYVEDEEVDFEKLINAPLPKVPRDVMFTAHWLAIEGVQPAIVQNPSHSEATRLSEGTPKGPNVTSSQTAMPGNSENVTVKPLVKHLLSKELQLYYERVCSAVTDETNEALRNAALASLRSDPGLHQLLPYFLQFVSEKVTHKLRDMFVLTQMMDITHALLENESLFVEPYVSAIIPPILTCLIGKRLGEPNSTQHYALRDYAASLIKLVCKRFSEASHTLRPRLTRTCLKHFLDPSKPLGTHYGAIVGLSAIGGHECVRVLILPNLILYDEVLKREFDEDSMQKKGAEMVVEAIFKVLKLLEEDEPGLVNKKRKRTVSDSVDAVDVNIDIDGPNTAGGEDYACETSGTKEALAKKVGDIITERIWKSGNIKLFKAILEARTTINVANPS